MAEGKACNVMVHGQASLLHSAQLSSSFLLHWTSFVYNFIHNNEIEMFQLMD